MERVIEYCSFHLAPGHSVKERKNFNKQFMRMDTARLCELASASHYLDLKSLIDLTCRALAKHIQGKNPEEIRETFNLPDDLTEEEKVAPIEFGMEDSRVRMLNSLYARKRKELAEAKRLESSPEMLENRVQDDDRDVDDLLSFIEGGGEGAGGGGKNGGQGAEAATVKSSSASERKRKKKERERAKKKERAEQQAKLEAERIAAEKAQLEADRAAAARRKALKQNAAEKQQGGPTKGSSASGGSKSGSKKRSGANKVSSSAKSTSERGKSRTTAAAVDTRIPPSGSTSTATDAGSWSASSGATDSTDSRLSVDLDSDDISDEDELDPDLRAAQDREVEEFARRLNGSLNDLAGQQASANGSVSHADMFAAFVTTMKPSTGAGGAAATVHPTPSSAQIVAGEAVLTPEPEAAPESSQNPNEQADRGSAETFRIQTLASETARLEAAKQRGTGPHAFDSGAEEARGTRGANLAEAEKDAVAPSPLVAPPPHDFRQKLAGSIQRSLHDAGTGGGPSVHRWVPPRRVVTAVWAPPPLFEASDAIPGVTKGYRAVSYCTATLTVPGAKLTDVCSASFTGLGQTHAQLSAHVNDVDEVTVILRGIDDDASEIVAETGAAGGNGPQQRKRNQPSAGQLTVVLIDYLAMECTGGSAQTSIPHKGGDGDTHEAQELRVS